MQTGTLLINYFSLAVTAISDQQHSFLRKEERCEDKKGEQQSNEGRNIECKYLEGRNKEDRNIEDSKTKDRNIEDSKGCRESIGAGKSSSEKIYDCPATWRGNFNISLNPSTNTSTTHYSHFMESGSIKTPQLAVTTQHSTSRHSTVQCSAVQYNTMQCNTKQYNQMLFNSGYHK